MAKLTAEERLDRQRGCTAGRMQGRAGRVWNIDPATPRSEAYIDAHRKAYLTALKSKGGIEPTAPKIRQIKPPSDKRLAEAYEKGVRDGLKKGLDEGRVNGFNEAFQLAKDLHLAGKKGPWSDQKMSGYQWGYHQAKANHPPHSSGDLRADPDFNEGYVMGHKAGSKVAEIPDSREAQCL